MKPLIITFVLGMAIMIGGHTACLKLESEPIVLSTGEVFATKIELPVRCLDGYVVYRAGHSYFYRLENGRQVPCTGLRY